MFVKSIATTLAILVASASIASAQSPTRIQQFTAWGAYSSKAQNGTLCYVLAVPTEKLPATVDHGDVFFIVSQRPGQNISYEPQVMVGYPMKADAKVVVTIDNKKFAMFTRGKSAWVEDAAQEPALIAAMKSGKTMSVAAKSGRGNPTNYAFSLKGISAALTSIAKCK